MNLTHHSLNHHSLNHLPSNNPNQKSRLFFLEFLIVLFFFLIISTVCIRLFAQAKRISDRAEIISQAQTAAASAAEILIADHGDLTFLHEQYEPASSSCIINITAEQKDTLTQYLIQMHSANSSGDSETVYELSLDLNTPLTRGEVLP